ncbi:MAG TPA: L,D-transpeptidase family protein [Xanthobacteraceae bacterium]|nr:L,D-transpeptidase family protein [Xanthobacteraceae bacterium]
MREKLPVGSAWRTVREKLPVGSAWRTVREKLAVGSAWRTVREKLPVNSAWRAAREKLPMPQGRLARSLASTAVIVVLSAAAGGKAAGPLVGARVDAPSSPPAGSAVPAAKIAEASKAVPAPVVPVNYSPPAVSRVRLAESAPQTAAVPNPADATGTDAAPTPQAAAPPPAASGPDAAIGEQLHDLAGGKFDGIIGVKEDRTTIDAFYSGRGYAPLWITDGKPNARAQAAIAYLQHVDADGLDPADYPTPDFASLSDAAGLAEAEMRLTASIIRYAHHAQVGRVHWTRVSGDILYDLRPPDPADVLAAMLGAGDLGETLAAYEPHDPAYLALKAKLAELRAGKESGVKAPIAGGPVPKVGAHDDRAPQLRERLGVAAVDGDDGATYDKALAEAVKKFQQQHQLAATGTLTPATLDVLNGRQPDRPTDIVLANMERWRWMPHDLGKTYVIVNLPDFMLRVMSNGKLVWTTKIVDGKPTTPTPIMSAEMKYITVNPTWNVPPSIANNEYLPMLQQDPTILARMGLNVDYNRDGTIHISQPPGENNALGRLRFNFPNKFFVYQHDSNEKYLFSRPMRAGSHGCMRIEDPVKYAEVLLGLVRPGEGYTQERIRRMFGNIEMDIQFPTFIPVHLTYQTAFVDDDGKLQFRPDIYGRDKALLAVMKSDERKVADLPVERKDNAVRRQMLAMPDQIFGGGNFFARLFGFPFVAQPQAPRRPVAQRRTDVR